MSLPLRPLGAGAPAVSAIGFGCMPLSLADRPAEAIAVATIHAALEAGATLLDTANVYCQGEHEIGHNERLVARAVAEWRGAEPVLVATKGGLTRRGTAWERDGEPDRIRRACEASLRALGVERIDLYQLHAPDESVPFLDTVGALADLQREGKVRWLGLSNVSVTQIRDAESLIEVAAVQNRLNPFFGEAPFEGVARFCEERGIGYLAYSPVGGGRLNRKLPAHPVLEPIARRHGASPHAVVIAWVMSRGATVIPIPAARSPEHARDAIGAARLSLEKEELAAISAASFSRA